MDRHNQTHPAPRIHRQPRVTHPIIDIGKGYTDQTEDELGLVTVQRQSERQATGKADVQSPSIRQVTFELISTSSCAVAARQSGPKPEVLVSADQMYEQPKQRFSMGVSRSISNPKTSTVRRFSLRLPNNAKRLFSVHRSIVLAPCHQCT